MCITPKLHITKSHVACQHHFCSITALSIIQTVATSEMSKKYFVYEVDHEYLYCFLKQQKQCSEELSLLYIYPNKKSKFICLYHDDTLIMCNIFLNEKPDLPMKHLQDNIKLVKPKT